MSAEADQRTDRTHGELPDAQSAPPLLRLPTLIEAPKGEARAVLHEVRLFHLTGASGSLKPPSDDCLPALLHRFRNHETVRTDYPVIIAGSQSGVSAVSLRDQVEALTESMANQLQNAKLLQDNLDGIEYFAAKACASHESTPEPRALLAAVGASIADSVGLRAADAERLQADLRLVAEALPDEAHCVGLGRVSAVHLAVQSAIQWRQGRLQVLNVERQRKIDQLRMILDRDADRCDTVQSSRLQEALAQGEAGLDAAALSKIVGGRRGPTALSEERRQRIEHCIEVLAASSRDVLSPDVVVICQDPDSLGLDCTNAVTFQDAGLPCAAAAVRFREEAERRIPLILAMRVAEIELSNSFDPSLHEPMTEAFGVHALRSSELAWLPVVIAVESVDRLTGVEMSNLVQVLLSGHPLRLLLETDTAQAIVPEMQRGDGPGPRFDAGLFGIGHQHAIVHQSSLATPRHLSAGVAESLASVRPSLHIVYAGLSRTAEARGVGSALQLGAAMEGRAHGLFRFDPGAGASWSERLDFEGNAQADADWPRHSVPCIDGGGAPHETELAFTFADFCLLMSEARDDFRVIPDTCPTNDLIPIDQFPLDAVERSQRLIPFLWGADLNGRMRRLVLSNRLVDACLDRLTCWRTLQELAGIHNTYVDRAIESERARWTSELDRRMADLEKTHASEVEQIRMRAASDVLGRLAEQLLSTNLDHMAPALVRPASAPVDASAPIIAETLTAETDLDRGAAQSPSDAVEEGESGFDEPYIESALCTSCNDCIAINPQMFVYNANKQAMIGNPDAGTYAQLVNAAEKCPARCIHPGKPRHPDEPNLEELMERARPFN